MSKLRAMSAAMLCAAAWGCQAVPSARSEPTSDQIRQDSSINVCKIRAHKKEFIGEEVRLHAVYETDHMFYRHLVDRGCGEASNLISVHVPDYASGEPSVVAFFKEEDAKCVKQGTVCQRTVDLQVDAIIRMDDDGVLFVELVRVLEYSQLGDDLD